MPLAQSIGLPPPNPMMLSISWRRATAQPASTIVVSGLTSSS